MPEDFKDIDKTVTLFLHAVAGFYWRRTFCNYPITPAQFNLLCYVYLNRGISIGSVAKDLSISYPAASNAADRLETKGLVKRCVDEMDGRQIKLTITRRGVKLFRDVSQSINKEFFETLRSMSEDDARSLMKGILSFMKVLIVEEDLRVNEICPHCGMRHKDECFMERIKVHPTNA